MGWWAAGALALLLAASACGQARLATPPEPEFTTGQRAAPTVLVAPTTVPWDGGEPDLSAIEPDVDPDAVDVDQMVVVDDAGNAAPNLSGWAAFDTAIERRLVPANASASVAVMVDGQVVHRAAFGERVAGSGDPAEIGDRFRIASISKTITAIVTLRLVEQGVLALDEPVGQVLIDHLGVTDFDPDVPTITVRGLLSHRAGFPKHYGTFFGKGATSCADAARQGLTGSVSPGGGYHYSNMGYCVLGVLLEAVTGKTYERIVYEELLSPLAITGMRMASTYDLGPDEVSHHPTPDRNFMESLGAAGAWNATPVDLVTILNSIDPATPGWKALSPEMMVAMREHGVPGAPAGGYGLGVINYPGGAYGHTGTIENAHSMTVIQPDGVTWALTVSGDYPNETEALAGIVRAAFATAFPGRA